MFNENIFLGEMVVLFKQEINSFYTKTKNVPKYRQQLTITETLNITYEIKHIKDTNIKCSLFHKGQFEFLFSMALKNPPIMIENATPARGILDKILP